MTDIVSALKAEISRIARKELRKETAALKKSVTSHRSEIAELKRRALTLEQELKRLSKASAKSKATVPDVVKAAEKFRFSAKGFATLRQRLGLSAEGLGLLLGTSSQSVYNWEQGKSHPREAHIPAIAALRSLGKREAAAKVAAAIERSQAAR